MKCVISRMSPLASVTQRKAQNPTKTHQCAKKKGRRLIISFCFMFKGFKTASFSLLNCLQWTLPTVSLWCGHTQRLTVRENSICYRALGARTGLLRHILQKKFKLDPLLQTHPTLIRYLCCINGMIYGKKSPSWCLNLSFSSIFLFSASSCRLTAPWQRSSSHHPLSMCSHPSSC